MIQLVALEDRKLLGKVLLMFHRLVSLITSFLSDDCEMVHNKLRKASKKKKVKKYEMKILLLM